MNQNMNQTVNQNMNQTMNKIMNQNMNDEKELMDIKQKYKKDLKRLDDLQINIREIEQSINKRKKYLINKLNNDPESVDDMKLSNLYSKVNKLRVEHHNKIEYLVNDMKEKDLGEFRANFEEIRMVDNEMEQLDEKKHQKINKLIDSIRIKMNGGINNINIDISDNRCVRYSATGELEIC